MDAIDQSLEVIAGELLRERGWRLAVAESCTGGLVGHRLTNISGSSTYFVGDMIVYAYDAKVRLLGVRWETLEQFGAVSRETVLEMARGVRQVLAADIGMAVSGIAGPGGGTPNKPVGLTWIGLNTADQEVAYHFVWDGDRSENKDRSAQAVLQILVDYLKEKRDEVKAMEAVAVKAKFDEQGQVLPLSFTWRGREYLVETVGRRWSAENGQHMLVMVPSGRMFELVFLPQESRWVLRRGDQKRMAV